MAGYASLIDVNEQKEGQRMLIRTAAFNYQATHEQLASLLDTPYTTFAKWSSGTNRMPPAVAVLLQAMVLIPELRDYLKKRVK